MYNTPGITTGIGGGGAAAALAVTGASTFALVALAVTLVVGGLLLLRTARLRGAASPETGS